MLVTVVSLFHDFKERIIFMLVVYRSYSVLKLWYLGKIFHAFQRSLYVHKRETGMWYNINFYGCFEDYLEKLLTEWGCIPVFSGMAKFFGYLRLSSVYSATNILRNQWIYSFVIYRMKYSKKNHLCDLLI